MASNFQPPQAAPQQMPQMGQAPQSPAGPQSGGMMPQGSPQAAGPAQAGQPGQPNMELMQHINNYIMQLGPDQQDIIKKASMSPEFPAAIGVLFGPDMEAYFTEVQTQVLQQQNSQSGGMMPSGQPENTAMAQAPAGQPAKATPNIPGMGM